MQSTSNNLSADDMADDRIMCKVSTEASNLQLLEVATIVNKVKAGGSEAKNIANLGSNYRIPKIDVKPKEKKLNDKPKEKKLNYKPKEKKLNYNSRQLPKVRSSGYESIFTGTYGRHKTIDFKKLRKEKRIKQLQKLNDGTLA